MGNITIPQIYDNGQIVLYNGDCMNVLEYIDDDSVDLILTDPPYGIAYKSNHYKYEWSKRHDAIENDDVLFLPVDELWPKIKVTGSMFAFYSYKNALIDTRKKNSIIWVKNNWTAGDLKGDFGNQYENIAFMPKPEFKLRGPRWSNVWMFDRVKSAIHPTEKPVELLKRIILSATDEGDLVFDPFAGSGSTLEACKLTGRRCVGVELNESYCEHIISRLRQEVLGI